MISRAKCLRSSIQLARMINTRSDVVASTTHEKTAVDSSTVADHTDPNRLTQLSGFLEIEQTRKVQIYIPAKNVMQSGTHGKSAWRLRWDTQERYENPLMGWASSGDPLSNLQMSFSSPEAAIRYCVKYGLEYEVFQPKVVKNRPKSYGANFAWSSHSRVVTK